MERGVTVEPFEKAAFSQEIGKVSETPVVTPFGLHLILVHEKRAEHVRPLEEVREEIAKSMALDLGQDKVAEVGESLLEDNLLGKDLKAAAEKFGLSTEQSGLLSAEEIEDKLAVRPEDAETILSGLPVDTLLQAGDAVLVVRVDKVEKERVRPFDTVATQITQKLALQKAEQRAMEKAAELRKTLNNGPVSDQEKKNLHIETAKAVDRLSPISPFLQNAALSNACFETKKDNWVANPFAVSREDGTKGALLVHVHDIQAAGTENWDRIHTIMEKGLQKETVDYVKSLFLNELQKKATIKNVQMEKADKFGG